MNTLCASMAQVPDSSLLGVEATPYSVECTSNKPTSKMVESLEVTYATV